jgi:hypothetical protein
MTTAFPATAERHVQAERFRLKLCRNYVAKGTCPYEYRCMFAHGEAELRTAEQNLRDGLYTEEAVKSYQRALQAVAEAQAQQQLTVVPAVSDHCPSCSASRYTHNPYSFTNVYTFIYDDVKSGGTSEHAASDSESLGATPVKASALPAKRESVLEP